MIRIAPLLFAFACAVAASGAEERFPRPEFRLTGHVAPVVTHPAPRPEWRESLDVALFAGAIGLSAWLVHSRRSRRGLLLLSAACLVWFGFVRQGCVCPVGSFQNVAAAVGAGGELPVAVLAFFLLPLFAALLWGRVFCASVCPLGAVQELALVRPLRVPAWIDGALRFLPVVRLVLAGALAACGAMFLVCREDPFVRLFRLCPGPGVTGAIALAILPSLFLGRPFCRWGCPYGVLLRFASLLAARPFSISPDRCVRCGLCAGACPYGALRAPCAGLSEDERPRERLRLAALILLLPALAAGGALGGWTLCSEFASLHPVVRTADALRDGTGPDAAERIDAFRVTGQAKESFLVGAERVRKRFAFAAAIGGGLLGLLLGIELIRLTRVRRRADFEADPEHCFACGRCIAACPVKRREAGA